MKGAIFLISCIFLLPGFHGTTSAQVTCDTNTQIKVRVKITPDLRRDEISWQILNTAQQVVASGDYHTKTVCLDKNTCYIFNLMDSYGDGMHNWSGDGKCELFVNDIKIDEVSGNYGSLHQFSFGCQPGQACLQAFVTGLGMHTTTFEDNWYTFTPDSAGIYEFDACGNACKTGIWIYDPCPKSWADDVTGTVAFSSSGCSGNGAKLTTSLIKGYTYLIRIGDINNGCASASLNWILKYNGPIVGCLDPAACNYDPTATIGGDCFYPGSVQCAAGPDLEIDKQGIKNSFTVQTLQNADQCAINEKCLSGYNKRYVLRFTTRVSNIGDQDYYIGRTPDNPQQSTSQFQWDQCHNHWHYYGYAEYLLYDKNGNQVPVGFKNGFCVEDLDCPNNNMYKFTCQNMGITHGCADIYDRDLDCQWVDLTDIDTGQYSLVVRVNYDRSPDKLGHVETNYDNNFAQFCLKITKDATGKPTVTYPTNCPVFTDCEGTPFGNAQLDCKGNCNGNAKKGDYNDDHAVNGNDVSLFMGASLGNDNASPCKDLNADGIVNVADAALAQDCNIKGSNYIPPLGGYENHCQFPNIIAKWSDTAWFDLGFPTGQYIDVTLKNPSAQVLAYQFKMTGLDIDSVISLNNSLTYSTDLRFNAANGVILSLSHEEATFGKSGTAVPLVRIYYGALTDNEICIDEIQSVVNERYERITGMKGNCRVATGIKYETNALNVHLFPNPFNTQTKMIFENRAHDAYALSIYDVTGKEVRSFVDITDNQFIIERGNLQAGVYMFRLTGKEIQTGKLVIQ